MPALFCSGEAIHPFVFAFFAAKAATRACPIRLFVAVLLSVGWADDDGDEVAEDEVDDDEDEVSAEEGEEVEDDSKLRTQAIAATRAVLVSIMRAYIL